MNFSAFDSETMNDYAQQAKEKWGHTPQYQEFLTKQQEQSPGDAKQANEALMQIFIEFGNRQRAGHTPNEAQDLVKELQSHISANYYNCSNEILSSLGQMYAAGGDFTINIDQIAGEGTAAFANEAITVYCNS